MKRLLKFSISILITLCSFTAFAGNEMTDSIDHVKAVNALRNCEFVIMVDQYTTPMTAFVSVDEDMNFIASSKSKGMIQLVPNPSVFEGLNLRSTSVKMTQFKVDKKGSAYATVFFSGSSCNASISISLDKSTNYATITISPSYYGGRVSARGMVFPLSVFPEIGKYL